MADQVKITAGLLRSAVEKISQRLTTSLTRKLRDLTPVDTAFAQSNWIPSIGSPAEGTDGERPTEVGQRASAALQEAGIAAVDGGYSLDQGPLFVANNVTYIEKLNNGSSRQAPKAFVQAGIGQTILDLDKVILS